MRGAAIDFLFVSAEAFPLLSGASRRTRGEGKGENTHVLAPCRNHAELSCRRRAGESLKGVAGGNRSFPPMRRRTRRRIHARNRIQLDRKSARRSLRAVLGVGLLRVEAAAGACPLTKAQGGGSHTRRCGRGQSVGSIKFHLQKRETYPEIFLMVSSSI